MTNDEPFKYRNYYDAYCTPTLEQYLFHYSTVTLNKYKKVTSKVLR